MHRRCSPNPQVLLKWKLLADPSLSAPMGILSLPACRGVVLAPRLNAQTPTRQAQAQAPPAARGSSPIAACAAGLASLASPAAAAHTPRMPVASRLAVFQNAA